MKIILCIASILFSLFASSSVDNYSQYINKSYIVLDSNTNKILEGKSINLVRSVASVSKIMSAIVAIEYGDLNKEMTILKEDINTYGSSIYLQEGEKITILDLVYGLMLRSGNDASLAIARGVGGSVDKFVDLMNKKANEIGMKNSVFNNPSGLDVDETGNLSTSYDLAILMSYAIKNETFLKISGTKEYKNQKGVWSNKNKLLRSYKNIIAGKTGFTYKAKRTLVTAAKCEETKLVVVTLDCGNDFNFHKFLYERNFQKYISNKILNKGDNYIEEYLVSCKNDIYVTLKKEEIEEYNILHEIDNEKSNIYLIKDGQKEVIGKCSVKKIENKVNKKSFIDKIREIFIN